MIKILFFIDKVLFVFPRVLLNIFFKPFTIFEVCLMQRIIDSLESPHKEVLMEHFGKINYVQRDVDDRQIRMYRFVPFSYSWNRNRYFGSSNGELRICRFLVTFRGQNELRGSLIAVDGVFAAINFSERAKQYRRMCDFDLKITSHLRAKNARDGK